MSMRRRPTAGTAALVTIIFSAYTPAQPVTSVELRARAADYTYNLDHRRATELLRQAVAQYPDDAANHRALASSLWLEILFLRGAVTVDHYLGSFSRSRVDLPKPPADLDAEFKREIATAIQLARRRVAAAPNDAGAHYALGTALGLEASYMASVEGSLMAGFRAARKSYDEQERVLALDPSRKDAGLIVGTYRYLVSTLSLPMRWMAYVAGFGGGKERGLRMIEEAAAQSGENRTDAQFALVLLYNREKRFEDALRVLDDLHRRYPRNRLVLLEAGATALRGGRAADADRLLTEGIGMFEHDDRQKIPGESALWHYKRGAARVELGRRDDAIADLRQAVVTDAATWVQGRAHVELARLASLSGDRDAARDERRRAIELCERANDAICVDDAKHIKNEPDPDATWPR
jgi:tetratricopeptide (TPR) repeat protein